METTLSPKPKRKRPRGKSYDRPKVVKFRCVRFTDMQDAVVMHACKVKGVKFSAFCRNASHEAAIKILTGKE